MVFFYLITLISTIVILFLSYNTEINLYKNDGLGLLVVILGLIEASFSMYVLAKTADDQN